MSVLARPGTPMSRQWPRAKRQASSNRTICSWPTMTLLSSRVMRPCRALTSLGEISFMVRHVIGTSKQQKPPRFNEILALLSAFKTSVLRYCLVCLTLA